MFETARERTRLGWIALGAVLAASVLFVVYTFLGTFVLGLFLYYASRPVYDRLRHRTRWDGVAAAASLLALAIPVLLLFAYTLAVALRELETVVSSTDAEEVRALFGPYADLTSGLPSPEAVLADPGSLLATPGVRTVVEETLGGLLVSFGLLTGLLVRLFVVAVLAYYLLKDGPRLSRWIQGHFGDDRGVLEAYFRAVDRDLQNVFFGSVLTVFVTAILAAVTYSLLNVLLAPDAIAVPAAVLVGLLTGVASLVPGVGMKVVYVPVGLYLAGVAGVTDPDLLWFPAAFFAVSFLVVDTVPEVVLRPYISGRHLHVGGIMLAYTLGPLVWGWYGVFLAPAILVAVVHFGRVVVPELVAGRSIAPYTIDPTNAMGDGTYRRDRSNVPTGESDPGSGDAVGIESEETEEIPAEADGLPAEGNGEGVPE